MARPRFLAALRSASAAAAAVHQQQETKALGDTWYAEGGTRRHVDPRRPMDVDRAVREGFERTVWGFKAVDAVSSSASRLRFGQRTFSMNPDEREEVPDHPLARLLNGKANPVETGRILRKRLSQQLLLSPKGAFVHVVRSRRGDQPAELHLLPPARTTPVPGRGPDGRWRLINQFRVDPPDGYGEPEFLSVEEVRWFREPHPTDPLRSMTPFEAAGLSLDLDHFARLYNRNFMLNDGRPGGVLGIKGELDDIEMDRVERKFRGSGDGVTSAGRLSVIAGDLSYVDTSATPRDAQYPDTSGTAKIEVLAAVGVPESQLGHASGSTFANAEVEAEAYWLITMMPHLDTIEDGFDEDAGDSIENYHDTSGIDALARVERRRREELRKELEQGSITYDEYRAATGRTVFDVPASRCLYLPAGRVPLAGNDTDQAVLDAMFARVGAAKPAPADPAGGSSETTPTEDRAALPAIVPGRGDPEQEPPPFDRDRDGSERKAVAGNSYEPPDDDGEQQEQDLAEALAGVLARMAGVIETRVAGTRARRHTRHWDPPGDRPLDADYIVQAARWRDEARAAAETVLQPAADAAAEALLDALAPVQEKALSRRAAKAVRAAVAEASDLVGASAARQAEMLRELISDADAAGASIADIAAAVRKYAESQAGWAAGLAAHAVTAALEGARHALAASIDADVVRRWRTRGDAKVRTTHTAAAGQERPIGEPFDVGGVALRYPGDPSAPLKETANCRCRVQYRSAATGQFVTRPAREVDRRPQVKVVARRIAHPRLAKAPVIVTAHRSDG